MRKVLTRRFSVVRTRAIELLARLFAGDDSETTKRTLKSMDNWRRVSFVGIFLECWAALSCKKWFSSEYIYIYIFIGKQFTKRNRNDCLDNWRSGSRRSCLESCSDISLLWVFSFLLEMKFLETRDTTPTHFTLLSTVSPWIREIV